MSEKATVIFVDGIPLWNDNSASVHLPTQFRSRLAAKHLPIESIVVRQVPASFEFDGVFYPAGSYVQMLGVKAVKAFTPAEFAEQWEVTGTV